jgi:hypothetical protein
MTANIINAIRTILPICMDTPANPVAPNKIAIRPNTKNDREILNIDTSLVGEQTFKPRNCQMLAISFQNVSIQRICTARSREGPTRTRRWRETKQGSPAICSWGVHLQNEYRIAANNDVIIGDFRCLPDMLNGYFKAK